MNVGRNKLVKQPLDSECLELVLTREWQPISTAPKDGTIIDGWMVLAKCHCPKCDEIYSVGSRVENIYWTLGKWYKHGAEVGNEVTHWMSRPAPPIGVEAR